ncbi:MAG: hypothetical protein ABIH67_01335 [Candidatus Uhrbacteria bacterium]
MDEEIQAEVPEPGPSCSDCCKKPVLIHVIAILVLLGLIAVVVVGYVKYNQLNSELESVQEELVELILVPADTIEVVEDGGEVVSGLQTIDLVQGLQLDIPSEWTVLNISEDEIEILTATDPYIIVETVEIREVDESYLDPPFYEDEDLVLSRMACAPAQGCIVAVLDDVIYYFAWAMVEGTEPVPENLDGPWFATANFDYDDIVEIMKTLR